MRRKNTDPMTSPISRPLPLLSQSPLLQEPLGKWDSSSPSSLWGLLSTIVWTVVLLIGVGFIMIWLRLVARLLLLRGIELVGIAFVGDEDFNSSFVDTTGTLLELEAATGVGLTRVGLVEVDVSFETDLDWVRGGKACVTDFPLGLGFIFSWSIMTDSSSSVREGLIHKGRGKERITQNDSTCPP